MGELRPRRIIPTPLPATQYYMLYMEGMYMCDSRRILIQTVFEHLLPEQPSTSK